MTFWDLLINASLLFLLFLKPLQMETNAGGASPREMFHRMCESYIRFFKIKDFKMLSRKKKWSSIKARASRLLRDWEVIVNAANFLLITYEIDYVFGLNSITNLTHWRFTLPSLQFLRLLCIVWAGDELLGVFRNIPISIAVIFRRTTRIVCCFFCFAAWIQLMEILGDPYTEYNGQKDLTYGKVVAFLYGKLVYLDVISIQLHTTLARISVYVVQAINLLFIAQLIPDMLKQLPNILRLRSFGKVYRKGDKAFVLLLGSVGPNAVEQFAEDFYISNREENILVLLESAASSCATEEMHSVARKHKRNLTVVTGSVFNQADIDKNISDMCRCAFVLANESAPNPEEEDHRNYLSVHVLKQHRSRLRVIVKVLMLHNKDLFYDIPNWSDERNLCSGRPPDRVVCVPEIHFALLAQRHFVPALSSIIHDWLNPSGDETIRSYVIPQDYGEPATRISIRDISTEQTLAGVRSFSPDTANAPTLDDGNAKPLRNLTPNKLSSNASVETNSGESSSPAFKTQDKIATDIVDRNHDNPSEDPSETERLLKKSEADGNKLPAESREDFTPSQSGEKSTDPCDTTNGTKSTSTVEENSKVSRLSPVSDSGGNNSRLQTEPQIPPAATAILTEHQANVQKNHSGVEFKDVKKAYEKLKDGSPFAVLQEGEYHLFPRDNLILGPGTLLFYVKHSRDTGTNNRADVAYNEAAKTAAYRYFEQPRQQKQD
ncbi:uncharacterized protein LOC129597301 isoform X2 [Paramacrobiotus metropolitanus]|nr:uncharacterized protein LOC129597301 isoform X2 [Paramacrobiotus metropolitanus]